jgi:hypothetical protein
MSGIGNNKPDYEKLSRVIHAFAKIGYDIPALEKEYGKGLDDWDLDDLDEARRVYIIKKAEYDEANSANIKGEQHVPAAEAI